MCEGAFSLHTEVFEIQLTMARINQIPSVRLDYVIPCGKWSKQPYK